MSLQGSLREFSATEILQLVASQRKTGCLVVEHDGRRATVYVVEGRIVSTRGHVPLERDPLYTFLRRVRRLSDEQLRGLVAMRAGAERDLEDLIVQGRYLTSEELSGLLERQILDDLLVLIEWTDGHYRFDTDQRWPHPIAVRLSMEAALIETARRADERQRFTQLFRDGRMVVGVRDLPDPEQEISEDESELFGIVDGQRTVAEVIALAPLSDYEAGEALQRMIEAGWLEFLGAADAAPSGEPPAPAPVVAARATAAPVRPSWLREAAAAVCGTAVFALLWLGAQALRPVPVAHATDTVFTAARIRDVRLALELYHRENGRYPKRLEDLVDDRWIGRDQLASDGTPLHYRLETERDDYVLDVPERR